ncbi:MAG: hypothetical protein ACLQJR_10770 [Stellaceae bacterium]
MSFATDAAKKREAEQKALAASMAACEKMLDGMRAAPPAEAERIKTRLDDALKSNSKLPMEFKRKTLAAARSFECMANTRAADAALNQALAKARTDDLTERNRLVSEARAFCNKAASLGADAHFRSTLNRKIEIIMMTGQVEHKGPTIAKPLDTTPKNPNSAKA